MVIHVFEYTVEDVFRLTGRGTAIVGSAPPHGEFTSGDVIEILRGGQLVLVTEAFLEMHVRPGTVSLLIANGAADVRIGDIVRRPG